LKLILDGERCQGHGRCYTVAPQLFGYDDNGQAVLLVADDLTDEQLERAHLAANNCPEYAIEIV
jgi:ferredoxin